MVGRKFSISLELEPLEARVVLSKGLGVVVALGDSSTDEYQFDPPYKTHARNWVEILASTEKADFGPLSRVSRGAPRDQGYATNWAYAGATSDQMVASQLPGAAHQVAGGRVNYGVIFSGTDNFLYYLQNSATNLPSTSTATAQLTQLATTTVQDIDTAVGTLLSASPRVKVIVATIPNVSALPIVQANAATPQARALVAAADAAIAAVDVEIRSVAASNPRVAVADIAAVGNGLIASGASIPFGGTTIDLTTASEDYHSLFLGDGLHLGTVAQGLVADTIIGAADAKFHAGVAPFTPHQIVGLAGLVQQRTSHRP